MVRQGSPQVVRQSSPLVRKAVLVAVTLALCAGSAFVGVASSEGNQLVDKLIRIFRGVNPAVVDQAVEQAKKKLGQEAKQINRENLKKLFDSQLATLRDRNTPEQIVRMLEDQRSAVVEKAAAMNFKERHVPFLPVIPRVYLSIYSQMAMVKNDGKKGYVYLKPHLVTDVVKTPDNPYYIFDIEDGEAMRGKTPQDAEREIKDQNRYGLTEVEAISLARHTNVLSRHYIDAIGSRYESSEVPDLWLYVDEPGLDWSYLGFANDLWGAASCGSRG